MKIGQGWDIHRLENGRKLILGGVEIPSEAGSVAHSDGDALAHAVIDAILGAAAVGDIGTHFPDTSTELKGADSMQLLSEAIKIAAEAGLVPHNIDSTIILQSPKLKPHIEGMRRNLAIAAGMDIGAVSVKAKTNEGLGETGAGRAVETQAIVLMEEL
ncbi:MAG TPA: 2-C-methyl-D-erythritol 2,4-cyclodiphosphate synthase [Spirochaeta sp.]|nr:2-C-methyl-D-erythritol 2,4-cyclodiphosphate synthase [Spirochaeta sp.]